MPRFSTLPTLYDKCKTISILDLIRWEYLKSGQHKSGTLTWYRNRNQIGSISITVNTSSENPCLELDYKCDEKPIKYRVLLNFSTC